MHTPLFYTRPWTHAPHEQHKNEETDTHHRQQSRPPWFGAQAALLSSNGRRVDGEGRGAGGQVAPSAPVSAKARLRGRRRGQRAASPQMRPATGDRRQTTDDHHAPRRPTHRPSMSSPPLLDVWEAAASSPYHPSVGKDAQFTVGAALLLLGMSLLRLPSWAHGLAVLTTRVQLLS